MDNESKRLADLNQMDELLASDDDESELHFDGNENEPSNHVRRGAQRKPLSEYQLARKFIAGKSPLAYEKPTENLDPLTDPMRMMRSSRKFNAESPSSMKKSR
jgi:hypothetical protein